MKKEKDSSDEFFKTANILLRMILYGFSAIGLWFILFVGVPLFYDWLKSLF